MKKEEFLRQLEKLLYDVPENERREAMEYYRNYFEDAGPEMEASIIDELGSPQEVAASIRKDLFGEKFEEYDFVKENSAYGQTCGADHTKRNLLIAGIVILTFPLWIGIAASVFGIFVAGIACIFALAVGVIAVVGALMLVGVVLAGIGMAQIISGFPAVGLVLMGLGLLMLAVSVLGLIAIGYMVGLALPWTIRTIVRICKKPFQKRGASI